MKNDLDSNRKMKTRTLPAVSDELVIPKPAPGENVYPIYSHGVICGYVYSGGDKKKPKIFLTEDNQTTSIEEENPTETKTDDGKLKPCDIETSVKTSKKAAAKGPATQPVNAKPKKGKTVSSTGKIPVLPNASKIDPKLPISNPSDNFDIPSSPTQPNSKTVDLGRKGSALENIISLPASQLATSPAKNVLQINNPRSLVAPPNSNPEPPAFLTSTFLCPSSQSSVPNLANKMTISPNATTAAKDMVILPQPNCNQPLLLASGNTALPATNWLTAPFQQNFTTAQFQPNMPNTVTYFIVPTGPAGQGQVYLTSSANNLSAILPTATTQSRTTPISAVNPPLVRLSSTTTNATGAPPLVRISSATTNAMAAPPLVRISSATTNATAAPPLVRISSAATNTMAAPTLVRMSSTTTNDTATPPVTMMPSQLTTPNNSSPLLSTLPLKAIVPKSTYVQLPLQLSNSTLYNEKIHNFYNSQFKIVKLANLEKKTGASETGSSLIRPVVNGEKSASIICSVTERNEANRPVAELTRIDQDKIVDSNLNANYKQTNKPEISCATSPVILKEKDDRFYQFSLRKNKSSPEKRNKPETFCATSSVIVKEKDDRFYQFCLKKMKSAPEKRRRGRPRKPLVPAKKEPKIPIRILPAIQNNLEVGSLIKLSMNEPSRNLPPQQITKHQPGCKPKHQAECPLSARPPHILWVANGEKVSKDSAPTGSDPQNNGADEPVVDLTEDPQEITNDSDLIAKSHQTNKSESSSAASPSKNKGHKFKSLLKYTKSFSVFPIKKRRRHKGRPRKGLHIPQYDKPNVSATGTNLESESSSKLSAFNLLPCGNYVLGLQNKGGKKNQNSEECRPSLFEGNEKSCLSSQDRIRIKTEPLDYNSGDDQEECRNGSDNCPSSSSSTVQLKLRCKEEKESGDESAEIQEEGENQLVISSCFSLSSQTESDRTLIPTDSVNSDFDNVSFLPSKTNSSRECLDVNSDTQGANSTNLAKSVTRGSNSTNITKSVTRGSNSTNVTKSSTLGANSTNVAKSVTQGIDSTDVAMEMKLKECSVRLKPLSLLSYSLLSSSECSLIEEDDFPCTKPTENGKASLKGDESNIKALDSSSNASALQSTKTKRSLEDLAQSILDRGCLKKLKESYESVETNFDSSVNVSSIIATGIKRSLEPPDPERLKRLKEEYDSVDTTTFDSNGNGSTMIVTGLKSSLKVPSESFLASERLKRWKEKYDLYASVALERMKKLKENNGSVFKTETPSGINEVNKVSVSSKSKSGTVSKNALVIPDFVNNSLKTSDQRLSALPSNDDSLVVDLTTEDNEEDSFIEGCISFHQQQLYMLQLQMDQHKTALEKLKKEQSFRKATK